MRRLAFIVLAAATVLLAPSCGDDATAPTGPDDPGVDDPDPYSHSRSPGASARDLLSDSAFTVLVVEVDYMPGYRPDAGALDPLRQFLENRLHKATITIREPTEVATGDQAVYTYSGVVELEAQHRDVYTHGDTLAIYMLIVDGRYDQENVLGIAYYNTSTAYFGAAFDEASGGLGQPQRDITEASTFRHELGHLLGLVGIEESGTEMQTEHQDEAHGHHCDNDQCLMYYAVASTDLFGSVFGGEIPSLDQNCLADLRANGGK